MSLLTTATSLTVNNGSSPITIGIAAPLDSAFSGTQLRIIATGLPSSGTVFLADGVTPVLPGELLTASELTGLTFAGTAVQSSQFTYKVSDPNGASASGTATLSVVPNAKMPQTTPATLTVAANSGPTAIGIAAPTDPNYAAGSLTVSVLGLPANGAVVLADGVTPVTAGETLSVAQLSGLEFVPTAGAVAESALFSYRVSDPSGAGSLGSATLSIAPAGNILTVGPGRQYSTIAAAVAASHNGDAIQVQAGTYINDFASIATDITLEGIGGMVNLVCTELIPNGKAILVTNGNITINNFSFSGAQVNDANGAGIRYETGNLVLNNDAFFSNQEGILGGGINPGLGNITINNSEFADNGVSDPASAGFGLTHNLYIGAIGTLTIDNSYFHDANVGHEIKSRALNTTITNSRIDDGPTGTASYSIDLPNGGNALIANNVIEQGPLSQNQNIIIIGEEGGIYAGTSLTVSGNVILNDLAAGGSLAVRNNTSATAQITGNQFYGLTASQIAAGPNTQSNNTFLASEPTLDTSHPWSPQIAGTGDIFGNGDVLLQNGSGQISYAIMAGGAFQGWGNLANTPGWTVKGQGKIAGGSASNVVIENASNQILYGNVVGGSVASWVTVATTPGYDVVGVGDINNDHYADIVVQNPTTGQIVYANMNGGVFTNWVGVGSTPGWTVDAIADVNGDGYADIVIQNQSSGAISYGNMANGAPVGWVNVATTPGYNVVGAGDINRDGYADIVVQNPTTAQIVYANMNGGVFTSWVGVGSTPNYNVIAVDDVVGTGYSDIVVDNAGTGQISYADMTTGTLQGWVSVATAPGFSGSATAPAGAGTATLPAGPSAAHAFAFDDIAFGSDAVPGVDPTRVAIQSLPAGTADLDDSTASAAAGTLMTLEPSQTLPIGGGAAGSPLPRDFHIA